MKKKNVIWIWLFLVVCTLSVLLYRSWWDRSTLGVKDPLTAIWSVSWDHTDIKDIDQEVVEEVLEDVWFSTEQFFDAYQQALDSRDTYLKQNIAETLYSKYWDERMLPVLVLLSMQQHDVKQALWFLSKADIQDKNLVETVGVHTIIRILLNTATLDASSLDTVKWIINEYYNQGHFWDIEKYYYYSLLALAKDDWTHFELYLNYLQDTQYNDWYKKVMHAKSTAESYKYAPEYYYEWLLWIELFYEGRYNLAQQRGQSLIEEDNDYLLWYQLQAYSALLLSNRQQASENFERIKQKDDDELYVLLQAISLYQSEVYTESILLLQEINNEEYSLDALRYTLLSYYNIEDMQWVVGTVEKLLAYEMTSYDYFSLFDLLLFQQQWEQHQTYDKKLIHTLIQHCTKDIWSTHGFICLYWKAWLLYHEWAYDKALPIMQWLVKRYPTATVYERIGDVAYKTDDLALAKKSFLQAFASSRDESELSILRQRVTNLLQ